MKGSNRLQLIPLMQLLMIVYVAAFCCDCARMPPVQRGTVDHAAIADGVYKGSFRNGPVKVVALVKIESHNIVDIELLRHTTWKGKKAEAIIPQRIIEAQSTQVDAVSGATMSSDAIMYAVQNALQQAQHK